MKSLQILSSLVAIASVAGPSTEVGATAAGQTQWLLAQALKAPGTVETRILKRLPSVITTRPRDPQAILKEECTWTNDNVASCLVWDCNDDGVCVELGKYCVDEYGHQTPCP